MFLVEQGWSILSFRGFYTYFKNYVAQLLTEQGCILVYNWVVEFFGYFPKFSSVYLLHIFSEIIGCTFLKICWFDCGDLKYNA